MAKKNVKLPVISFILPSLRGGGVERMTVKLAAWVASAGYQAHIVVLSASGPNARQIPESVKLINLDAQRARRALPALVRYFRAHKPSGVISSIDHINVLTLVARFAARQRFSVVVSIHSQLSANVHDKSMVTRLTKYWIRPFLPFADGIVAVSQGVAREVIGLAGVNPTRVRVIYNPILSDDFPAQCMESVDEPWFTDMRTSSPNLILAAGRLEKVKDFHTLIRAFKIVRQEVTAKLVILGEGSDRQSLEALAHELDVQDDILLPGHVENPYKFMRNSDVFVLSSKFEGLGNVLVEAMAAGTAVVSTDCPGGPAEVLNFGELGALVRVGDHERMAQAILRALGQMHRPIPPDLQQFTVQVAGRQYLNALGLE